MTRFFARRQSTRDTDYVQAILVEFTLPFFHLARSIMSAVSISVSVKREFYEIRGRVRCETNRVMAKTSTGIPRFVRKGLRAPRKGCFCRASASKKRSVKVQKKWQRMN